MNLFFVFRTIPLALAASVLAAVLVTTRRGRERFLKNRWRAIGSVAAWGIAVFVLTIVVITLFSANEYYKCGVGPKSILPSATIADLESSRMWILVEYSLRLHFGTDKYDDACYTTQWICALANKVMVQAARQTLETGIGEGYGQEMNTVGFVTAIPSVLLFAIVLWLRKKRGVVR